MLLTMNTFGLIVCYENIRMKYYIQEKRLGECLDIVYLLKIKDLFLKIW